MKVKVQNWDPRRFENFTQIYVDFDMRSSFIFCLFHYFLSEIRVRRGEVLGRNPRLRMQEMAFPRFKIQNSPEGAYPRAP